ncbi:20S-pre-rRNA D-site endonuclease nob1; AltName: Full=Pre-rRNA-processing endonuclease nob1 [Serendipita indica DSM 11827]|nr:20S-pre-rRNA D-site endonuclease nob1; AltName: Full=Pre-rRNA-processing endonuclease nob1 [Serendipita indica DSM 11827]
MASTSPRVQALVLDAGPLLSLAPLRGLAKEYYTVPQVLGELKDEKSRTHFQNLGLSAGVKVETRVPDTAAIAHVTLAAKKSGDYSVLSTADLYVIALTYALHQEYMARNAATKDEIGTSAESKTREDALRISEDCDKVEEQVMNEKELDELAAEFERLPLSSEIHGSKESKVPAAKDTTHEDEPLYDDPSDEDDGQGEWITPTNVALHKSRALDLLPDAANQKSKKKPVDAEPVVVGCMTADYAMQNVLLHMGLNLVGVEGTRISSVKSWVLRCHACFKICKDSSKKFCPSCGNPSLLRTTISTTAPTTPGGQAKVQIHLKNNFQYRTRGTKYSIPMPKPGTSKTGSGTGIILREDQQEYMKAVEKEAKREKREHDKLMKTVMQADSPNSNAGSVKVGDWNDPDWIPDMLVGAGKRQDLHALPTIGMGRKNPNERRRRK